MSRAERAATRLNAGAMVVAVVLMLALASCGAENPEPESTPPLGYFDKTYGFFVKLPPRFAGDWWQGRAGRFGDYAKAWTAADSPVRHNQPLDYFGVTVSEVRRRTPDEIEANIRSNFFEARDVAAQFGNNARVLRVERTSVDGAAGVTVDAYIDNPFSGDRERMRWTIVLTERHTYQLAGMSTPRTWRRNLPAFEAMLASFRLGPEER